MLRERIDHRRPSSQVSLRHFVEHPRGTSNGAASGEHGDQRGAESDSEAKRAFENVGMDPDAELQVAEGCDGGNNTKHGDLIRRGFCLHNTKRGESEGFPAGGGETGNEGGPGD